MSDTGFKSRASAIGARVFVATLVFGAPILAIVALVVIALSDRLWRFFADSVATNILVPYGWALGSALLVLSFAALVGCVAMLIARSRERTGRDSPPA
ncbi:MAG: hypothetical protein F4089_08885 [Gammaproteobacteria bacterium]|nr:hypothetical protein [Gammaproteobacteria bacterium]MYJ75196.1 hypothetical protein [Gammaproteobacteria bacterium]